MALSEPSFVAAIPAADPAIARAHFAARLAFETDCADVHAALSSGAPDFVLLEVRGPGAYARGHVPGALNLPFTEVVNADGTLKSVADLKAVFAHVDLTRPIVTTCGSGVTASVLALALARLGRPDVAVYDGSWTEWGGRADTAVVQGA